jgi:Tfp pilus assembly protein PilO
VGTLALILAALLAVVCIVVVAWPILRSAGPTDSLDQLDAEEREWLALLEARDRTLIALQELETDHREGKVSDEDYRTLVSELRAEAARALAAIDAAREAVGASDDPA